MGNYVTQSALQNETIIYESRQHWIALLPRGVISIFLILCGFGTQALNAFFLMLVIAFLIIANPLIRFLTSELGFTNKRLIGRLGLINTKSLESPLNKINNVSVNSGLFGKILGYGNINITTSSGSYIYKGIAKPEQFKSNLMKQIDQFEDDRIKQQALEMANAMKSTT